MAITVDSMRLQNLPNPILGIVCALLRPVDIHRFAQSCQKVLQVCRKEVSTRRRINIKVRFEAVDFSLRYTDIIMDHDMALPLHCFTRANSKVALCSWHIPLLNCNQHGLCIHPGSHFLLLHTHGILEKVIISEFMFRHLPNSKELIRRPCNLKSLIIPHRRNLVHLNRLSLSLLHKNFPLESLTGRQRSGKSDFFVASALQYLVINDTEAAGTCMRWLFYDTILLPLCTLFDNPAPVKKLQLQLYMAAEQDKPAPIGAQGLLKVMSTPLLHHWLRLTKGFRYSPDSPTEMEVLRFIMDMYTVAWIPLEVLTEREVLPHCPFTDWLEDQLRQEICKDLQGQADCNCSTAV